MYVQDAYASACCEKINDEFKYTIPNVQLSRQEQPALGFHAVI